MGDEIQLTMTIFKKINQIITIHKYINDLNFSTNYVYSNKIGYYRIQHCLVPKMSVTLPNSEGGLDKGDFYYINIYIKNLSQSNF